MATAYLSAGELRIVNETVTRATSDSSATETRSSIAGQPLAVIIQASDDADRTIGSWGWADIAGSTNQTTFWVDATAGGASGDVCTHNTSNTIYVDDGGNGWTATIGNGVHGSYDIVWTKNGSGLNITCEILIYLK